MLPMQSMQWASAISREADSGAALAELTAGVRAGLGGNEPHLLFLFASADRLASSPSLGADARRAFGDATLVGCTGAGVIGDRREVEGASAVSLTAGHIPGAEVEALHLDALPVDDEGWRRLGDPESSFIVLCEPATSDVAGLIAGLGAAFPGSKVVGGLASGNARAVFCNDGVHRSGSVVLGLSGSVAVDTVIAQGCRPIGEPLIVTSCEGHRILGLGGRPPGEVLRKVFDALPVRDRNLFRHSLFLGVEMKDQREYHQGDFLVRNIVGLHPDGQALVVAADMKPYQAVQFHLRDAEASDADLRAHLERYRAEHPDGRRGGLLFSCLGRGEHLYGAANHDCDVTTELLGELPLGGFFCNGEIGPVGGTTFLHGYTSAFAFFRER
jgi:small ligand-binding sensory domain FIST